MTIMKNTACQDMLAGALILVGVKSMGDTKAPDCMRPPQADVTGAELDWKGAHHGWVHCLHGRLRL